MGSPSSQSSRSWLPPPFTVTLGDDDLHVWLATLDLPRSTVDRLRQLLSSDETVRADRFHFAIDRDRFIVARGYLRTILGKYISTDPSEIRLSYGEFGKPSVTNPSAVAAGLKFNLAHSGGLALYAMTLRAEIGVDLEEIRADFSTDEIAERFFSGKEIVRLRSLPPSEHPQAFFHCWTRKEAFVKAKGTGLSQALDQFDVTLGPDEPAVLLETRWDENEASRWFLKSIELGVDFAAALAFEGHDRRISYWKLDDSMTPIQTTSFVR